MSRSLSRRVAAVLAAVTAAAVLAGCAGGGGASSPIRLGWSGDIPPLDPAASDSVGSFALLSQLYPSLLTVSADEDEPVLGIAESAEWVSDGVYEVVLKPGLEFANGDALTTSDVKFSVERQLALQSEDGSWRQFSDLDSVEVVDDTTVRFVLGSASDSRFPFVLAGPAGLILDEEVFFADELTPDEDIVDATPFAGPFALASTRGGRLVLEPYADYGGTTPALATVEVQPGDGDALADQLGGGSLDAVTGRLSAASLEKLSSDDGVELSRAASGRVRMLSFDFTHMPFGTRTETPDAAKAAAVRAAIAALVDREAIVEAIGSDWVEPLTGYLPDGIPGATDVFTGRYGAAEGGPDADAAEAALVAAAVETPIDLTLHVDLGQVGEPGSAEVAALAEQLEDGGLFSVTVVETDAEGLSAASVAGEVQAVFTSLLPASADPQAYLAPYRSTSAAIPGFGSSDVDAQLAALVGQLDPELRVAELEQAQATIASALPAIPITQGVRMVFARSVIAGVTLDDSRALDLARLRR